MGKKLQIFNNTMHYCIMYILISVKIIIHLFLNRIYLVDKLLLEQALQYI